MFQRVGQVLLIVSLASGMSGQMVYSAKPAPIKQQKMATTAYARTEPRKAGSANTPKEVVVIPLNNTGIADWSFLNPRRPRGIRDDADIEFDNQTSDRTFKVSTDLSIDVAALQVAAIPNATPEQARFPIPALIGTTSDLLLTAAPTPADRYATAIAEVARVDDLLRAREEVQKRFERELSDTKVHVKVLNESPETLHRSIDTLETTRQNLRDAEDVALKEIDAEIHRVMTGGGTTDFSPARTQFIADIDARLKALGKHSRSADEVTLRHRLQLAREILAKQDSPNEMLVAAAQILFAPARMDDCKAQGGALACTAVLTISPRGTGVFPHAVIASRADQDGPATFNVAFFDETESPANSTAYIATEAKPGSPKSVGTITAVAGITASDAPFIPKVDTTNKDNAGKCPSFCPGDQAYLSGHLLSFGGTGRVDVKQTYGNLLDGKVTLKYKGGDLGNADDKGAVTLSQYQFNINAETGLALHFGKFDFAKPANEIAISESGEGFQLGYQNFGASYIVHKKNATDTENHHASDVFILQGNNLPVSSQFVRSVDLIAVYGRDRTPDTPGKKGDPSAVPPTDDVPPTFFAHSYRTVGANLVYAIPSANVSGTLAGFDSTRHADNRDGLDCSDTNHVCDGSGRVGLLTLTRAFSINEDNQATRTITGTFGIGTADSGRTPGKDESYIGEHAGFDVDDHLFFNSLMDKVEDGSSPRVGLPPGLAGKRYIGVQFVDNTFSLLEQLAGFLGIRGDEIKSKSTIVSLGDYRARQDFNGARPLGREVDIDFKVESPKGVTVSLGFGYFIPGSALHNILLRKVWDVSGGISIKI